MLFLGLLIYFLVLLIAYGFIFPLIPATRNLPVSLWVILLYAFSTILGVFMGFLIDVYNPRAKERMRNLIRIIGVKWLSVLTVLVTLGYFFLIIFWFHKQPGTLSLSLLVPVLFVSSLNAIGFEIKLKRLEEKKPGKVVLPEMRPPEATPESDVVESPETTQASNVEEEIVKTFKWKFERNDYSLNLVIRRNVYDSFKNFERILDNSRWSQEYVTDGISEEIRELAQSLFKVGMLYGTYQEVSFVLSFVQQVIRYQVEEAEYPKYPIETLVDGNGDCEDFSILGAALLKCMGYEIALLLGPGHAALGVAGAEGLPGSYVEHRGIRYYYCEMTGQGWQIGQIPEGYEKVKIDVCPVPDPPPKVVRPEDVPVTT